MHFIQVYRSSDRKVETYAGRDARVNDDGVTPFWTAAHQI